MSVQWHTTSSGGRFSVTHLRFPGFGMSTGSAWAAVSEDRRQVLLANDNARDTGTAVTHAVDVAVLCLAVDARAAQVVVWDDGELWRWDPDAEPGEEFTAYDGQIAQMWPALESCGAALPYLR